MMLPENAADQADACACHREISTNPFQPEKHRASINTRLPATKSETLPQEKRIGPRIVFKGSIVLNGAVVFPDSDGLSTNLVLGLCIRKAN